MVEEKIMKLSLLDYISWKCGCEFISDLQYIEKWQIFTVLIKIGEDAFSAKEWKDALSYLIGQKEVDYCSERDARKVLLEKLEKTV